MDASEAGLVSYAPNVGDQYRATAAIRSLVSWRVTIPGELLSSNDKIEMVIISQILQKRLGFEIAPDSFSARATSVIE